VANVVVLLQGRDHRHGEHQDQGQLLLIFENLLRIQIPSHLLNPLLKIKTSQATVDAE